MRFFQSAGEAIEAGFRPCKRCRSDLALYCPMDEIAGTIKQHLDGLYERRAPWREVWREIGLSERRAVGRFK